VRKRPCPQDPTACSPGRDSRKRQGCPSRVNSQCSTRKHGRPVRHSLTQAPDAP